MQQLSDILTFIGNFFTALSIVCLLILVEAGIGAVLGKMIKAGSK